MTAPVREVELRFPGPDRDLAGTLTLPAGAGPFPAAVLVSGSGPIDRDSNAPRLPIDSTRQLAHALARAGIASLRYDKRGVGGSRLLRDGTTEGRSGWMRAGLFDNADDVAAGYAALAARPETDAARVSLIGHSEGATLAIITAARLLTPPAAALQDPRAASMQVPAAAVVQAPPAAVVLLAGAARPGDALLRWQANTLAPTLPALVRGLLKVLRTDLVRQVSRNHDKIRATTTDVARIGGVKVNAKWTREYLGYDPRDDLARLTMPVLAITGGKDLQVDPADLTAIAQLVLGPVQTWLAPDVTHMLRTQHGPASLRAYKEEVRRPVDPAILDRVTGWLTGQVPADDHSAANAAEASS
ncbi:acyl-CoA thioester hydrolase [Actinoplanes capillaceus]|uniref:Acyl-CoA thioester hydrolase n=1 Tax=Actinoplanes campanulatus TaxID=113559 RepID=A0ABQ3WNX8_9ACTN|nr:alpha/beta fold hydrolase [Actinoplanes capillaceus]GID47913.1 acyl-CoA thioester hydrolase [Actinoplanes capillaceus]